MDYPFVAKKFVNDRTRDKKKLALAKYFEHSYYWLALKKHIMLRYLKNY